MDFEKHFDFIDTLGEDMHFKEKHCCVLQGNIVIEQGMTKCKVCSNIISNIVDNPEWRYYGNTDSKSSDPTRCGMPVNTLLPESSVGSTIAYNSNTKTMNQIRKFQKWQGMPYKERSLYKVFLEIQEKCKKNNIPNIIINEAKSLYTIISKTKISRGSNRQGIIAACVYFACKEWDLDFVVIGKTTKNTDLTLVYNNEIVGEIPIDALASKAPVYDRKWTKKNLPTKKIEVNVNLFD